MKEKDRQRIERHLEEFAAWRASGLSLQTYAEQHGESLSLWRGRLTWERRWQQMLAGTYQKPVTPTPAPTPAAFVKAVAQPCGMSTQSRPAQRVFQPRSQPSVQGCAQEHICIVVSAPGRSDLQANIHWPIDQMDMSGHWLREVLA